MGSRNPLDRSAAHEALLYTYEPFAKADLNEGSAIITAFLEDFYASPSLNMYDFATTWQPQCPCPVPPTGDGNAMILNKDCTIHRAPGQPPHPLPPLAGPRPSGHALADVQDGRMVTRKGKRS